MPRNTLRKKNPSRVSVIRPNLELRRFFIERIEGASKLSDLWEIERGIRGLKAGAAIKGPEPGLVQENLFSILNVKRKAISSAIVGEPKKPAAHAEVRPGYVWLGEWVPRHRVAEILRTGSGQYEAVAGLRRIPHAKPLGERAVLMLKGAHVAYRDTHVNKPTMSQLLDFMEQRGNFSSGPKN
ncbi:MAG: hypothetical protein NT067_00290 [Candidatus Diapherotrites archaeon]|nr:hypothetical protein [Candidatus Diapherotrites archaeon]